MTQRQWLSVERLPEYSGINARVTLRRMCLARSPASKQLFGLAIETRDAQTKRLLFRMARDYRKAEGR